MLTRRETLQFGGISLIGVAGCLDGSDQNTKTQTSPTDVPQGYVRPEGDPLAVPEELHCDDDEFERRSGWVDEELLRWGAVPDGEGTPVFALRSDGLTFERGEEVTVTLTNISDDEQVTGNAYRANFDVLTEAGWQDPRGWPDGIPKPITSDVWNFAPGEQFKWTFELTERGVIEGDYPPHHDDLTTCPGLPPGRYRFATAAPDPGDVAVAFDLIS